MAFTRLVARAPLRLDKAGSQITWSMSNAISVSPEIVSDVNRLLSYWQGDIWIRIQSVSLGGSFQRALSVPATRCFLLAARAYPGLWLIFALIHRTRTLRHGVLSSIRRRSVAVLAFVPKTTRWRIRAFST